jgi:hypothetical protein
VTETNCMSKCQNSPFDEITLAENSSSQILSIEKISKTHTERLAAQAPTSTHNYKNYGTSGHQGIEIIRLRTALHIENICDCKDLKFITTTLTIKD